MTPSNALDLVRLRPVMERGVGSPSIVVGLIDGPVSIRHPSLARIPTVLGRMDSCDTSGPACAHGTFVAGVLVAARGADAPSICPGCTLLVRPIFSDRSLDSTPEAVGEAVGDCVRAGARVINLSLTLLRTSKLGELAIKDALDTAASRGVIVVAAAGNQSTLTSTAITRHPWVIPVVACDLSGNPGARSNLGASIGLRGLRAPGVGIASLGPDGSSLTLDGTSVAAPFVSGAIALLWSAFPSASASKIRLAVLRSSIRRASVTPPMLDAWESLLRINAS
jgi:subtilisin family serine protease